MERYVCIHCHFYQPPRENRAAGLRLPLSRLERADHRGVLRSQLGVKNPDRFRQDHTYRQQLLKYQLQLRPYAAFVDGRPRS